MTPDFQFDQHKARIASGWKDPIGKLLTDRRIAQLQREGKYGPLYKLPPRSSGACAGCHRTPETRKVSFAYLPKPGVWCPDCIDRWREVDRKDRELRKRIREAHAASYDITNFDNEDAPND